MMPKAWPILDLDIDATEAAVRRAYAAQLRLRRPDDDSARFQALRAEYESALATVRSQTLAVYRQATLLNSSPSPFDSAEVAAHDDDTVDAAIAVGERPDDVNGVVPSARERASREIRACLVDGDVLGACDRYDRARARGEVGIDDEQEIELMLARNAMAHESIGDAGLAQLAQRYRWDDALSRFPLGEQIVARYRPQPPPPRPGERFVGQWNWGAFCLTPFWLMAHRRWLYGVLFLIFAPPLCLSVIGFFAVARWAAHYGRNGNAIAVRYRTFASDEQFVAVQNAWRNWGIPIFAVAVTCMFVVMLALIDAAHPGR